MKKILALIFILALTACLEPITREVEEETTMDEIEAEGVVIPEEEEVIPAEEEAEADISEWILISGEPPYADPDPIAYEGRVVLTGYMLYKAAYVEDEVPHFHVLESSLENIPEFLRDREFNLTAYSEEEGKNVGIGEEMIQKLEGSSADNPATVIANEINVYIEGSPLLNIIEVVD